MGAAVLLVLMVIVKGFGGFVEAGMQEARRHPERFTTSQTHECWGADVHGKPLGCTPKGNPQTQHPKQPIQNAPACWGGDASGRPLGCQ
jgi:hypothetical protein